MTTNRVALVIGSGEAKCAAALGMWKTLQEAGIEACMAVGSSGGSLYAAVIALGYEVERAEQLTLDLWRSDLMEGYTNNLRAAMSGEARFTERSGLINDESLIGRLHNAFGMRSFSDARIPLYIVSTGLFNGEMVVHESGSKATQEQLPYLQRLLAEG